jgi:hypothetical protein
VDGADSGTDVENARFIYAFSPDDLDQFSCRGMQLSLSPSGRIRLGIETVVPEPGEILVAAEPTRRCHHTPMLRGRVNIHPRHSPSRSGGRRLFRS